MMGEHDSWRIHAEDFAFPMDVIVGAVEALLYQRWQEANPSTDDTPPPLSESDDDQDESENRGG